LLEESVDRCPGFAVAASPGFGEGDVDRIEGHGGLFSSTFSLIGDVIGISRDRPQEPRRLLAIKGRRAQFVGQLARQRARLIGKLLDFVVVRLE